jgi:phosphate-selective porin OprO and OprP
MPLRSILSIFASLLAAVFLVLISSNTVKADSKPPAGPVSKYNEFMEKAEEEVRGPVKDWQPYWKDGLRMDSPENNLRVKINLSVMVDGGYIEADDALQGAFPNLDGPNAGFRQLRISTLGTLYDWAQFKLDIDFDNVSDIKDEWIRFTKIPYIGHITLGHMKESFSLEELTSRKAITFLERSLPTVAFTPGRNLGISSHTAVLNQRMTWAVGAFFNMDSFDDVGNSKDQLTKPTGWNLTARITGLPWYVDDGRRLLHLGLSFTHKFGDRDDIGVRIRTRPESRLTDDRLVDTGEFLMDSADLVDAEFAFVKGPLSFQGEYFHTFADAGTLGNPDFWGFYLFGSWFITGEHRNYDIRSGTFNRSKPKNDFCPRKGGWGAWELAGRFSFIDLNDAGIRGGKEASFTAGLNWYLNRKTRFMLNYTRTHVKDRETSPAFDSGRADIFQGRFQIEF